MRNIRPIREHDYDLVIGVINDWWAGREMANQVPRELFAAPHPISCMVEEESQIVAFCLVSGRADEPESLWCRWIGVRPSHRKSGLGKMLYERFAVAASKMGYRQIRAGTSIVNKASIAFHTHIGFQIASGNDVVDGICVTRGDSPEPVVKFVKALV